MTAKEYLGQAYKIDKRIQVTLAKAEKMRACIEYRSPSGDGMGGCQGSSDKLGEAIAKIVDYKRKADELVDLLVDKRIEIENTVRTVCNPVQREILERRYLLYQSWESHFDKRTGVYIKGIAELMGYSERWIYKQHGMALQEIEKSAVQFSEIQY